MTSLERKAARYKRRKAKREAKRAEFIRKTCTIENVAGMNHLCWSSKKCTNGTYWKPSIQKYMASELFHNAETRLNILDGVDIRKGFVCFTVRERGKLRDIKSVHVGERVPQKSYNHFVLMPLLTRNIIFDNGACLPGKGTSFALARCEDALRDYYRKYGDNDGWVFVFDLSNYFGSIPHKPLIEQAERDYSDPRLQTMGSRFVSAFPGEYGVGLGSETSQTHGVSYPNAIDHYIKDQCGVKDYGRYMDDGAAVCRTKDEAISIMHGVERLAEQLGLTLSKTKTRIVKLSKGFRFLKTFFILTETGKIVKKVWHKTVTRERRKLKKFAELVKSSVLTVPYVLSMFKSWLGGIWRKSSRKTIWSMKLLFIQLFPTERSILKWKPKTKPLRSFAKMPTRAA